MAHTANAAQRDGWQYQADHLALTHTAVGIAAMVVAKKARRRPALRDVTCQPWTSNAEFEDGLESGEISLANELERTRAKLAKLEEQVARKAVAARIHEAHVKTLAAQTAAGVKHSHIGLWLWCSIRASR